MQISLRSLTVVLSFVSLSTFAAELPTPQVPNPEAFRGWTIKPYDIDELDFAKVKTKTFACADTLLIPLSADQSTKKYHKYVVGSYDHSKLKGDSEACVTSSVTGYCLRGDTVQYTIMSDTFKDSCGNTYRAFWEVLFLTKNESMGTLCSLGRTFYEKADAQFPGETEIGPTYPVEANRFIFVTELFATDLKK